MIQRFTFRVDPDLIDALSGCLFEAGALGLEERGDTLSTSADPQIGQALCAAYAEFRDRVGQVFPHLETWPVEVDEVSSNYHDAWLSALEPVELLPGLTFCPTTRQEGVPSGSAILWFEPLPAFGAGEHPTTQMAVHALAEAFHSRSERGLSCDRLLDVGTGSGVLALVGLWLGIGSAVGTDILDDAVEAATKNAVRNRLKDRFDVVRDSLPTDGRPFQLALANVERPVLLAVAPELAKRLEARATLIITGFLEEDEKDLALAYENSGFRAKGRSSRGDWSLLVFEKVA
jgi:ribosomal protein L11 methyltransferase